MSSALRRLKRYREGAINSNHNEIDRILALPRRPPLDLDSPEADRLCETITAKYARKKRATCKCKALGRPRCITKLLPIQAWALNEAATNGGTVGAIAVGGGKTGLDVLMALAVPNVQNAVLLIPPSLMEQLHNDYLAWREHFKVPSMIFNKTNGYIVPGAPTVHVIPFSRFSRHESTALLGFLKPDLIIVDEAHKLKNPDTATTSRIMRYFKEHPGTRLCAWSGTLTSKSIKDYAHLCKFALGEGSPLPLKSENLNAWAGAIDPSDNPSSPGKITKLCQPGETIYEGFRRHLRETPGVITTRKSAIECSLYLEEVKPKLDPAVEEIMQDVRRTWCRPDGEELVEGVQLWACLHQLASGFYYRYIFPRGEAPELIDAWFKARKAWNKELREKLATRKEHLDSPLLCKLAAIRHYEGTETDLPTWEAASWPEWREIEKQVIPETQAVWVSDYLVNHAVKWGKKHRGLIWYSHDSFGRRVAERGGFPFYGPASGAEIAQETGKTSIVASIDAHGTGRDGLQYLYQEQLVANPPSSGEAWEQLLGRLHRHGQSGGEVRTFVYRHTEELQKGIDGAIFQARYIEGTLGTAQKLLLATVSFPLRKWR